jgi:hypothetical protein
MEGGAACGVGAVCVVAVFGEGAAGAKSALVGSGGASACGTTSGAGGLGAGLALRVATRAFAALAVRGAGVSGGRVSQAPAAAAATTIAAPAIRADRFTLIPRP